MQLRSAVRIATAALVILALPGGAKASEQTGRVPLANALDAMEPYPVWQHFYDLTQIPRPSEHEQQATAYVADFGRSLGLETIVDSAGNVIIRKPATAGLEGRPGVVLQAHLDMVPQKTEQSSFDFETDPINAFVEDGWVRAEGTTLGADDGIGVAMIMALLQADDVAHGPLEAVFTVNEESGFTGVNALSPDALNGRMYINVDNENEGQFMISSAGGVNVDAGQTYNEIAPPSDVTAFEVKIDGLIGGHSGIDIDKGRASAHQLFARLVVGAPAELDVRVANVVGGDLSNAIPRTTTAVVTVPSRQADAFGRYLADFEATVAGELATTDPGVTVTATPVDTPQAIMEPSAQTALIGAVYAVPQGVYRMSPDVPGLVETSGNLGVLSIRDGQFTAVALARSALDSERDAEAQRFAAPFEQAGATVTLEGAYSSWPPNPDSPLLAQMTDVYTNLFGTAPAVSAVHAGLETSVIGVKYPGMDMISIGATDQNVHSPDERLEVASVPRVYDLLVAALGEIN